VLPGWAAAANPRWLLDEFDLQWRQGDGKRADAVCGDLAAGTAPANKPVVLRPHPADLREPTVAGIREVQLQP
jgi:hypothetical protein